MTYEVVRVKPDSPDWLEERHRSLGASEVAGVLGISPYQTPLSVYRSKMGIDDPFDPERAYVGHAAEVLIEGWLREFHPEIGAIQPALMVRSVEYPWLHASLDRVANDGVSLAPIQMKSFHFYGVKDWADEPPLLVQAQVQTEILVFDAPFGWAAGFGGDMRCRLRRIERDDEFIHEHLIPKTYEFWAGHVQPGIAPPPSTVAELADVFPHEPKTSLVGSESVLDAAARREVLLSDIASMKEEADALTLAIGQYLGSNETLLDEHGTPVLTYRSQKGRRSADLDVIEAKYPEIAAEVIRRGNPFKVMRRAASRKKAKAV